MGLLEGRGAISPPLTLQLHRAPRLTHRGRTTLTAPSASKFSMTCGPLPEPALARRLADGRAVHMRFAALVMPHSTIGAQHDCYSLPTLPRYAPRVYAALTARFYARPALVFYVLSQS